MSARVAVFLVIMFVLTAIGPALGANTVALESKVVAPSATGVTVGVHLSNDETLLGFSLPFEVRQVSGGAFIAGSLDISVNPTGRLAALTLGSTIERYYPTPAANTCSGPTSGTYTAFSSVNFVSPDGFLWFPVFSPCVPIGSDGAPGAGTPSALITFNVGAQIGSFEIDTCCIQSTHLNFNRCNLTSLPVSSFTKSVVTVANDLCNIVPQDVNCDGAIDVRDVVGVVDGAFRGGTPLLPCCVP